ncbi:hypothetical protein E1B28_013500 [Marasmius oreades]|uniref:Uncharacterized protein n=1 Tax=Marasmius oreades TaxID=181124 RepID=A0A9P7UMV5_9AGAR|nr:uncharacterized protein E1B28_013500 [Marasmius oreades]KAG7087543.1 hypothetical protein E1B28_013500 [Marasmius oreades]
MPASIQPFIRQVTQAHDPVDFNKVWTFNALQILAFVLNILVVGTAVLSGRVRRAPIWFIFMGGWILWSIAHSLLFLSGRQFDDKPPPHALCLLQAGLVYAIPPYMEFLNLALLVHVYLVIRATIEHRRPRTQTPLIFIFLPLGIFLVILIEVLVIGVKNPELIARMPAPTPVYCNVTDRISFKISAISFALGVLSLIGLEVALGIMLYRNWEGFQVIRHSPGNGTMVFRIFVFSVGPTLALIIEILSEISPKNFSFVAKVVVHFMPSMAAIIFGTHRDIIRAWYCFGNRRKVDSDRHPSYPIQRTENIPLSNPSVRKEAPSNGKKTLAGTMCPEYA